MKTSALEPPAGSISFRDECLFLAPLETFDPQAFRGSDDVPQQLCNFVLALALIFNDCKDAIYAHVALAEAKPEGEPKKTRVWGAISGVQVHAFRAVAGLLHELFALIQASKAQLEHPFFETVVQHMNPASREAWTTLVSVAFDGEPKDNLGKRLRMLRNKVSFHYDAKAILSGYEQHFIAATKVDTRAFISRGNSMRATRFYFVDAAATGYLKHLVGAAQVTELMNEIEDIIGQVNQGLMMVVTTFIQRRNFAFQSDTELA